jgi:hypothetical protein
MANYYEILQVSPSSTSMEIEQALDSQYNKTRRLVTHHDPNVINQANLDLQVLEKIRSTLLDPGKRIAYDAAIDSLVGLGNSTPNTFPGRSIPGFPQAGPQAFASAQTVLPTSAFSQRIWICQKCHAPNVINSQFCKKCGEILAAPCPACEHLVEKIADFCPNCGVNVVKAQQKKELEAELSTSNTNLANLTKNVPVLDRNMPELNKLIVLSGAWAVVSLTTALTFYFGSQTAIPGLDLAGSVMQWVNGGSDKISGSSNLTLAGIGLLILSAVVIFLSAFRKTSPFPAVGALIAYILVIGLPRTIQSILMTAEAGSGISLAAALLVAIFIYAIVFKRLWSLTKKNFAIQRLYNAKVPRTGFLGTIFAIILFMTPVLYALDLIRIMGSYGDELGSSIAELGQFLNLHQSNLLLINEIQLAILGIFLIGFTLADIRTAQAIETRFKQAVMDRSEGMEKLTHQIRTLELGITEIDLRSR